MGCSKRISDFEKSGFAPFKFCLWFFCFCSLFFSLKFCGGFSVWPSFEDFRNLRIESNSGFEAFRDLRGCFVMIGSWVILVCLFLEEFLEMFEERTSSLLISRKFVEFFLLMK